VTRRRGEGGNTQIMRLLRHLLRTLTLPAFKQYLYQLMQLVRNNPARVRQHLGYTPLALRPQIDRHLMFLRLLTTVSPLLAALFSFNLTLHGAGVPDKSVLMAGLAAMAASAACVAMGIRQLDQSLYGIDPVRKVFSYRRFFKVPLQHIAPLLAMLWFIRGWAGSLVVLGCILCHLAYHGSLLRIILRKGRGHLRERWGEMSLHEHAECLYPRTGRIAARILRLEYRAT
jgi:hypothetical protein